MLKALEYQETDVLLCLPLQKPKNGKPVSDQWVPAFVITDDDGQPSGMVQVCSYDATCKPLTCGNGTACNAWHVRLRECRQAPRYDVSLMLETLGRG